MEDRGTTDGMDRTALIGSIALVGLFIFSVIALASVFFGF